MSADARRPVMEQASRAAEALEGKLPALVLTGAGISVESGIPPFRGPGGLWSKYDPMEYGHIDTLKRAPEKAWILLWDIIGTSSKAVPNEAHRSLASMEKKGYVGPIVTQNVDGMHLLAGSEDVLEIHGNARRIYCQKCGREEILEVEMLDSFDYNCECGGLKRPDIVFFGESLPDEVFRRSLEAAASCESILIVGTSGIVYPAAMIPEEVKLRGKLVVEVNPSRTPYTERSTDHFIKAPATVGVPALEKALDDLPNA